MPRTATIFHVGNMECKVIKNLGSGSFGCVSLAKTTDAHIQFVALKIFNGRELGTAEYKVLEFLSKRDRKGYIPQVFGFSRTQKSSMICLEFIPNGNLLNSLKNENGFDGSLIQPYFNQLVDALAFIHKHGVVHRDIKPENLLISASNSIKIGDFGLAQRYRTNNQESLTNGAVGTMVNWAPEVFKTVRVRGPPLDVYAAATTLIDMFAIPSRREMSEEKYYDWRSTLIFAKNFKNVIPDEAQSLLLGILAPVDQRFNFDQIKSHPWLKRQ